MSGRTPDRPGRSRPHGGRPGAVLVLLVALAGCASSPPSRGRLLPELDPEQLSSPAQATHALEATESARTWLERDWGQREYDCYQRWLVYRCLGRLSAERRDDELRLKTIEVRARQILREDDALRANRALAQTLADRQAEQAGAERRRAEAIEGTRRREADAADNRARRAADDARRAREAPQRKAQAAERDRERRERQAEADRRRDQAPANARAFRERQRDQVQRVQEHDRRDAERASKAREERARDAAMRAGGAGGAGISGGDVPPAAPR